MSMARGSLARSALPVAMAMALAACGGGGGSNVRPTPPPAPAPTPPPTPPVDNGGGTTKPQPTVDAHLVLTNDTVALAAGFKGSGITIGLIDTGINRAHPALTGRVLANFIHVSAENDLTVDDKVGHGTTVAQLAAGRPVGKWPGGIAQDATLVSARIINDKRPTDDGSGQGNEIKAGDGYGDFFKSLNTELANAGARIINNSWGGLYWTDPALTVELGNAYRDFISARGGIVVFANGNSGGDPKLAGNPSDNASLPSKDGGVAKDLAVGWLTVAALDTLNPTQLTGYSQACGVAMDYCLAAPGDVVFTGATDTAGSPTYWVGGGTSYAAPLVSGAAAVVWSAFPYFNNDLVRQTLLGTAKDLGAPGVDAIFGHGLLDVGKAVKGPSQFDWGDVSVILDGTSTWSNPITGAGGLIKAGSGTLVLSNTAAYSGATRIDGGSLQLGAGLGASNVTINAAGTLRGIGTIAGNVSNNGHFVVSGASGDALAIGGNYLQGATGWLDAYIGRALTVTGKATLQGGTLNVLGVYSGYTTKSRETMVHAGAGVTGTIANLKSAPGVFLDGKLAYDANNVFLDITRVDVTSAAQSMDLSASSQAGAGLVEGAFRALDAGVQPIAAPSFMQAAGALQSTRSVAAAERSLASLSGDIHATDAALAMLAADGSRHQLEARLDSPRTAGAWASELDGSRSIGTALGADMRGYLLGQEFRNGGNTWGLSVSRSEGNLWNLGRRDRSHDVQTEGQLYGFGERNGNYLMARAAFGQIQRDVQREVLLGDSSYGVDSRYADQYLAFGMQAGRQLRAGGGILTPYIGAQALQLQRSAFREEGAAGFGLDARRSTLDVTQALLGTRFQRDWRLGSARVDLHGRMEWQRTLSQNGAIDATFTAIDARSPLMLDVLGRDVGVVGAGFAAQWNASRLGFDLDARRGQSRSDLGANLRWSVAF
ncbi:MAG: S8 family serine peptidase [Luteimonas sp.]